MYAECVSHVKAKSNKQNPSLPKKKKEILQQMNQADSTWNHLSILVSEKQKLSTKRC